MIGCAVTEFVALMHVGHRCINVFMTRMSLHLLDAGSRVDCKRTSGVTESMSSNIGQFGTLCGPLDELVDSIGR